MKKLLSSFLVMTVILAMLSTPAGAFVPQGAVKYSPDVVRLNQDFSGALTDFTVGTDTEESSGTAEVVSGKIRVENPAFNLGSNLDLGKGKTKYVLEFSVSSEKDYTVTDTENTNYSLYWYAPNRGVAGSGYGITIPYDSLSANTVRTYKMVINESATTATAVCEKAFVQDGDGEIRQLAVAFDGLKLPATRCYADFSPKYLDASEYKFYLGGKAFAGGTFEWNMPYADAPVLDFDNIKINTYKLVAGNTPNQSHGISYSEDFEDAPDGFSVTNVDAVQKTEENGNSYYSIKSNSESATLSSWGKTITPLLQPNTTITLDLKCETEGMPFLIHVGRPSTLEKMNAGDSLSYGSKVMATATLNSTAETASTVQFYVNGQPYGSRDANFTKNIQGLKIGTNTILTKIYCESGLIVQSKPQIIKVDYKEGKAFDIGREYEIDYKYIQGDGSLTINDGYFRLSIQHTRDGVTYTTADGSETYANIGGGEYKIVVASGHAEIYWNGQFLKSILLPYDTASAAISHSSLSNLEVKSSGVKAELLSIENGGSFEADAIPNIQYYSLEFDKKDSSTEEIYINDGMYGSTLYFRNDGIYAKRQLTTGVAPTEQKLADSVKTGYYRLTVGHGVAQLTLNNEPVGNFRMVFGGGTPKVKRTVTSSSSSSFFAMKKTDDVYYHSENFEGDAELSHEYYWQEGPINYRTAASEGGIEATRTSDSSGNHYMKLNGTGVYVLNAVDQYPSLKWRGRVDSASGKVFAIIRQSLAQQHTKIGYDFGSQSWFFEIMQLDGSFAEEETQSAATKLQAGKWYDFEVVCEGYTVTLMVNGEAAFTKTLPVDLDLIHYGRFGLGVENSAYSFDDFRYVGQNRVTPGANIFVPLQFVGEDIDSVGNWAIDRNYANVGGVGTFHKDADGTVYGIATKDAQGGIKTTDNGKTWQRSYGSPFTSQYCVVDYTAMPNGNLVGLVPGRAAINTAQYSIVSTNGGKTWSQQYLIHDGTYGYIGTGERLRCTKDGRIFAVFSSGYEGFTRMAVFYSDDGMNWTKSETEFTHYETGIVSDEMIVVDTPRKNEVWLYFRSNTGFVTYYKSFDNGRTFDKTPYFSGLVSVASTYSIIRDHDNPQTYYAAFMYDTEPAYQISSGLPRNRSALAVSYDGMETWEYVSDLIATTNVPYNQLSDLNMYHFRDGHLYWKMDSLQGPGLRHIGVQDISKMKSLKRFPQPHFRYFIGYNPVGTIAQRQCVVSKTKGVSWIYGEYYESSVSNGKVDTATAEKIFGLTASGTGASTTLKLGGGSVNVTADSNGYFDIQALCNKLGKVLRETDTSYCIMDKATSVDLYQEVIDNLV